METFHKFFFKTSSDMKDILDNSIDLVVTSPPYPMIAMWDDIFSELNIDIKKALKNNEGELAFEFMNKELDKVWKECHRVLKDGGILCINIGDATRTMNDNFQTYSNSSRILNYCLSLGFQALPKIIWKKPTNSPNKFMGSGMLPPGAYITLEHEYILILRKGNKKLFKKEEDKQIRRESVYFWEERNKWFTDIWEGLNGVSQKIDDKNVRERSGAYPFELAYRLINMFSVRGDIILDPFVGTGTTAFAAISSGRNSISFEIDSEFKNIINNKMKNIKDYSNEYTEKRINEHISFINNKKETYNFKYLNKNYNFCVMTKQEINMILYYVKSIKEKDTNNFSIKYEKFLLKNEGKNRISTTLKDF